GRAFGISDRGGETFAGRRLPPDDGQGGDRMIGTLLRVDLLKIRRKGMWFLTFLGPLGVVSLQIVNYGVRKEWLLQQSDDDWLYYLDWVHAFTPLALVLGIAILTSFMASIENETNAWKQLLSLPVSKMSVYLSKFTVL